MLILPDLSKPFEVQCDACGHSLGAVLLQEGHAIAYEIRILNDHEKDLSIYVRKLIAILHVVESGSIIS